MYMPVRGREQPLFAEATASPHVATPLGRARHVRHGDLRGDRGWSGAAETAHRYWPIGSPWRVFVGAALMGHLGG